MKIIIILIIVYPIIKIALSSLIFKLSAALLEPITDKRITNSIYLQNIYASTTDEGQTQIATDKPYKISVIAGNSLTNGIFVKPAKLNAA